MPFAIPCDWPFCHGRDLWHSWDEIESVFRQWIQEPVNSSRAHYSLYEWAEAAGHRVLTGIAAHYWAKFSQLHGHLGEDQKTLLYTESEIYFPRAGGDGPYLLYFAFGFNWARESSNLKLLAAVRESAVSEAFISISQILREIDLPLPDGTVAVNDKLSALCNRLAHGTDDEDSENRTTPRGSTVGFEEFMFSGASRRVRPEDGDVENAREHGWTARKAIDAYTSSWSEHQVVVVNEDELLENAHCGHDNRQSTSTSSQIIAIPSFRHRFRRWVLFLVFWSGVSASIPWIVAVDPSRQDPQIPALGSEFQSEFRALHTRYLGCNTTGTHRLFGGLVRDNPRGTQSSGWIVLANLQILFDDPACYIDKLKSGPPETQLDVLDVGNTLDGVKLRMALQKPASRHRQGGSLLTPDSMSVKTRRPRYSEIRGTSSRCNRAAMNRKRSHMINPSPIAKKTTRVYPLIPTELTAEQFYGTDSLGSFEESIRSRGRWPKGS